MTSIKRNVRICGELKCSVAEALIDTGADRTVVPAGMAKDLGLKFTGSKLILKSASGHDIEAEEATAHIMVNRSGCIANTAVVVPKDPSLKDVIIGNDFMQDTSMVVGYTKPRIISCPSRSKISRQRTEA